MRATLRITWLLLSLSFLLHNACSDDDSTDGTSVTKDSTVTPNNAAVATNVPTKGSTGGSSGTVKADEITQIPTTQPATPEATKKNEQQTTKKPTQPTAAVTSTPIATTATTKPDPVKPQATTVTVKPTAQSGTSQGPMPGVNVATPAATTTSLPQITTPAGPPGSSDSSVLPPSVNTVQTAEASEPSKTSEAPGNVGGTKAPTVPAATPGPGTSKTHIPITSTMSQGDSRGGTQEVPKATQASTSPKATEPAGHLGTTFTPATQTKSEPSAVVTLHPRAGTTSSPTTTPTTPTTTTTTMVQPKKFVFSLLSAQETEEEKDLAEVCKRLMPNWQNGTCTLTWRHHNGKVLFDCVEINGKVKTSLATQYYEEITKKPTDNKTLIAILASCGALLIMIVILAVCASHHRRPYNENQQHLTEELHTVENGYHDNPTLEVMEVQPEMQEKKVALNGEFNDSWIVPIDNLLKEDIPDEEDTHL